MTISLYTHADLDGWHKKLESFAMSYTRTRPPEEFLHTFLILGDWFEEKGDLDTAAALRYQYHEEKRPYQSTIYSGYFAWFREDTTWTNPVDIYSDLPISLCSILDGFAGSAVEPGLYYPSQRRALEALWRAFPLWEQSKEGE